VSAALDALELFFVSFVRAVTLSRADRREVFAFTAAFCFRVSFLASFAAAVVFLATGFFDADDLRDWAEIPVVSIRATRREGKNRLRIRHAGHINFMFYLSEMDFGVGFEESLNSFATEFNCS
jgi:hypothetical protein